MSSKYKRNNLLKKQYQELKLKTKLIDSLRIIQQKLLLLFKNN